MQLKIIQPPSHQSLLFLAHSSTATAWLGARAEQILACIVDRYHNIQYIPCSAWKTPDKSELLLQWSSSLHAHCETWFCPTELSNKHQIINNSFWPLCNNVNYDEAPGLLKCLC